MEHLQAGIQADHLDIQADPLGMKADFVNKAVAHAAGSVDKTEAVHDFDLCSILLEVVVLGFHSST